MAYVRVIPPGEAEGELRRAYEAVAERRGGIANVFQVHSLRPDTMRAHLDLYESVLFGASGLTRLERELLAVVVSAANSCTYCILHHSDALRKYEPDPALVEGLARGEVPEALPPRAKTLAHYARKVTRSSFAVEAADIEVLRAAGLSDEEILSANLATSYFNFVNRVVDGLGVEVETNGRTYRY